MNYDETNTKINSENIYSSRKFPQVLWKSTAFLLSATALFSFEILIWFLFKTTVFYYNFWIPAEMFNFAFYILKQSKHSDIQVSSKVFLLLYLPPLQSILHTEPE